jgi:hypothetical protein
MGKAPDCADDPADMPYVRAYRKLEAENAYLRSIIVQWQKNCTGMHGSQKPCGLSADHTVEPRSQSDAGGVK